MRSLLLLTLGSAAVFAGSSPAFAYPLNDGRGTVIWPFEAHGSAASPGSPVYTYDGQMRIEDVGITVDALSFDGGPDFSGFSHDLEIRNRASGPDLLVADGRHYIGISNTGLDVYLTNADGTAFPGSISDFATINEQVEALPDHAPSIDLFENRSLTIFEEVCYDIVGPGTSVSLCSQGGGERYAVAVFGLTIDRFVDPVPEPSSLALGAVALLAVSALRRAARR